MGRCRSLFLRPTLENAYPYKQRQVSTMFTDVIEAAFEARLSPLASRIAVIVADIDGRTRALRFIAACQLEDEARGIALLDMGTVLKLGTTISSPLRTGSRSG